MSEKSVLEIMEASACDMEAAARQTDPLLRLQRVVLLTRAEQVKKAREATANALAVLESLAAHVRPTCTELYDEAVAALARVRSS